MPTYTMKQYSAAPQHKKKMRLVAVEKTIDFHKGPVEDPTDYTRTGSWAASDVIELIGLRADQILVGATVEVIHPTTTAANSGHKVSLQDPSGRALAYFPVGLEATTNKILDPYDVFFQPVQFASSDTIDLRISAAFTTGVVKVVAYILEEDRS